MPTGFHQIMQLDLILFDPAPLAEPDEFGVGQEAAYSKASAHLSANGMTVVWRTRNDRLVTVVGPLDAWMLGYLQALNSCDSG